jgi:hypothetical protein
MMGSGKPTQWGRPMPHELDRLIEVARRAEPSAEQREEQRRSFAYGNTAFENDLITREMVDRQADRMKRELDERRV